MGVVSKLSNMLRLMGVEPIKLWKHLVYAPRFAGDVRRYNRMANLEPRFPLEWRSLKPFLLDYSDEAGVASGQYFHQDIWAARKIYEARPSRHVDIGSRVDGFVAHVLCFMPIEVIDIRPLTSSLDGLTFVQADATDLVGIPDASIESLSSLHAVEHFGLGRYSDPIDPTACFRAMKAMQRVVRPGGILYFSVPIGREHVEFNAQRVFSPQTIFDTFRGMDLISFSAVDDLGHLRSNARRLDFADARYSCGLFEFRKKAG